MSSSYPALAALFLLLLAVKMSLALLDKYRRWPFYPKKTLSQPEQILYFRLCKALPEHLVFAQVGLSRILGVKKGHNFYKWFNRINKMSADFVVCAKDSTVIAVIELDDSSHNRPERRIADAKKDRALKSAGIPVIRWHVKTMPDTASIRKQINSL